MALIDIPAERGTRDRQPTSPARAPIVNSTVTAVASRVSQRLQVPPTYAPIPDPPDPIEQVAPLLSALNSFVSPLQRRSRETSLTQKQRVASRMGEPGFRQSFDEGLKGRVSEAIPAALTAGREGLARQQQLNPQAFYREAEQQLLAEKGIAPRREVEQRAYELASQAALGRSRTEGPLTLDIPTGQSQLGALDPTDPANPIRTKIPYADQVADKGGRAAATVASTLNPVGQYVGERLPYVPTPGGVADALVNVLVPREVWELAIELVPGIGSIDELERLVREGAPEALRALRSAVDSPEGQKLIKGLASETGAVGGKGEPEDLIRGTAALPDAAAPSVGGTPPSDLPSTAAVPDNVMAALKQRSKVVAKDPMAFQAQWELLPPVNQKFIMAMADAVIDPATRKQLLEAGRIRQAGGIGEAIAGEGDVMTRALAARGAEKGKILPAIKPVAMHFEPAEIDELLDGIQRAFDSGVITKFEFPNAASAMNLLLDGGRLPTQSDQALPNTLMPHEIKLLGRIYGPEFEAILPKTPEETTLFQKGIDLLNLPRAIVSSFDISAPGRQGIVLAARNPKEWFWDANGAMFRSWMSEDKYEQVLDEIRTNPKFEEAFEHGLDFTDIGGGVQAEEAFVSRWAQNIPGIRRSERAYSSYLNYLRMKVYEKNATRVDALAANQGWDDARLYQVKDEMAWFLNVATGRGDLGGLTKYTPTMNALFFSPRFLVSRPQSIWAAVRPGANIQTRKMVAENLGAFVGMGVSILGAAAAAGGQVELDPRSSDFGKMRFGNQRIEFWGGFQPLARYIAQIATGDREVLDSPEHVGVNRWKTLGRFFRSKLSPGGALGYDLLVEGGKDYEGDNFLSPKEIPNEAFERLAPLVLQDAWEGYNAQGPLAALSAAGASAVGGGVGTFEPDPDTKKKRDKTALLAPVVELAEKGYRSEYWQTAFTEGGFEVAKDYDNIEELRDYFTDYRVKNKPDTMTESQARYEASQEWGRYPVVKAYNEAVKQAELRYWQDNPAELVKAVDDELMSYSSLNADEKALYNAEKAK